MIPVNSGQQPNNSVVFDGDAALQSVLVSDVSLLVSSGQQPINDDLFDGIPMVSRKEI